MACRDRYTLLEPASANATGYVSVQPVVVPVFCMCMIYARGLKSRGGYAMLTEWHSLKHTEPIADSLNDCIP